MRATLNTTVHVMIGCNRANEVVLVHLLRSPARVGPCFGVFEGPQQAGVSNRKESSIGSSTQGGVVVRPDAAFGRGSEGPYSCLHPDLCWSFYKSTP